MYVTHAELAENPGALELSEVASDEHARPVAAELLDALLRGQDVAAWSPEDVAAALEQLDGKLLKRLGVTVTADTDAPLIKSVDGDVEKLVSAIVKQAVKGAEVAA